MTTSFQQKNLPIDINCDMGEGMNNEAELMPYISSANIACGFHAGDEDTMHTVVALALKHNVAVGAHPSFPDRENFGRTEMKTGNTELYDLIAEQLFSLNKILQASGGLMKHVKPHGALYNLSARDPVTADIIAKAVKDFDSRLILFGLSGSVSLSAAQAAGLQTAAEVFADRTYQDDGSLTPRSMAGALIHDRNEMLKQVLQLLKTQTVNSVSGKTIPLIADTVCIHGDGAHATDFVKAIYEGLSTL